MGSRSSTHTSRGRSWRPSAGAASFRHGTGTLGGAAFGPPEGAVQPGAPPADRGSPWTLTTSATLRPGDKGYKTAELIVAEADRTPPPGPDDSVHVRVAFEEEHLRGQVKEAGGRWRPETKVWELPLRAAAALGLESRPRGCQGDATEIPRSSHHVNELRDFGYVPFASPEICRMGRMQTSVVRDIGRRLW